MSDETEGIGTNSEADDAWRRVDMIDGDDVWGYPVHSSNDDNEEECGETCFLFELTVGEDVAFVKPGDAVGGVHGEIDVRGHPPAVAVVHEGEDDEGRQSLVGVDAVANAKHVEEIYERWKG